MYFAILSAIILLCRQNRVVCELNMGIDALIGHRHILTCALMFFQISLAGWLVDRTRCTWKMDAAAQPLAVRANDILMLRRRNVIFRAWIR